MIALMKETFWSVVMPLLWSAGGAAAPAVGSLPNFPTGEKQVWPLHKGVPVALSGPNGLLHLGDCLFH